MSHYCKFSNCNCEFISCNSCNFSELQEKVRNARKVNIDLFIFILWHKNNAL